MKRNNYWYEMARKAIYSKAYCRQCVHIMNCPTQLWADCLYNGYRGNKFVWNGSTEEVKK